MLIGSSHSNLSSKVSDVDLIFITFVHPLCLTMVTIQQEWFNQNLLQSDFGLLLEIILNLGEYLSGFDSFIVDVLCAPTFLRNCGSPRYTNLSTSSFPCPFTLTALFIQEFICINNHHAIADVGLFSLPFGMELAIQKYCCNKCFNYLFVYCQGMGRLLK